MLTIATENNIRHGVISELLELMGITEVGKYIGWDRRKASVYYSRGKLPEPYALVGGKRPVWTKGQINAWVHSEGYGSSNEQKIK